MLSDSLSDKTIHATKWSAVTQVASKAISPVTQFVLAHLLAPEVFGVIALVNMITSFADMFTDAGFQKYLVQHQFEHEEDLKLSANVAFWTNLFISLIGWVVVIIARDSLAMMLGDSTIGAPIAVACASLPLTAAVSVQTAMYQRSFDFKTLFYSKLGSSSIILLASVPLAIMGMGYWSIIVATILSNAFLALWLTIQSEWKPSLDYSFGELRSILSYSLWTLGDAFIVWLTAWIGTIILNAFMDKHHVGLYNNTTSVANSVTMMIEAAVLPVAFSSLSRVQDNHERFESVYLRMQKALALAIVPLSCALFVFRIPCISVLMGEQWLEGALLFGMYALGNATVIIFGRLAANAYRADGKPRVAMITQLSILVALIIALLTGARGDFTFFTIVFCTTRLLVYPLVHLIACAIVIGISPIKTMYNLRWIYITAVAVSVITFSVIDRLILSLAQQCIIAVFVCFVYLALIYLIRDLRNTATDLLERFGIKRVTGNSTIR